MRARATLVLMEGELRANGAKVTIHALWVALADRAGANGTNKQEAAFFPRPPLGQPNRITAPLLRLNPEAKQLTITFA